MLIMSDWLIAGDEIFKLSQGAYVGSMAVDFYSGMRLDQTRYHEANPVMGNRAVQIEVMAGTTGVVLWLTRWAYKRGNKKAAVAVLIGGAALHGFAASHNWRLK